MSSIIVRHEIVLMFLLITEIFSFKDRINSTYPYCQIIFRTIGLLTADIVLYLLLCRKMFLYCNDKLLKVGQVIYLRFWQQHFEIDVFLQDNGVLEALAIFFFEFIAVEEFYGNS